MTLPYAFAKRHGLVLRAEAERIECVHRASVPLDAMAEAQRVAGAGLAFVAVDDAAFDAALRARYRDSASEAADFDVRQMATSPRSPTAPPRSTICSTSATIRPSSA